MGFEPEQWEFQGLWTQDVFSSCCWTSCWIGKGAVLGGFAFTEPVASLLRGGNFFFNKELAKQVDEYIRPLLQRDTNVFEIFAEEAKAVYERAIVFAKEHAENEVSVEVFDEMLKHARSIYFYWCVGAVYFVLAAERVFQEAVVAHGISAELVPNLIPQRNTPLSEHAKDLQVLKELIGVKSLSELRQDSRLYALFESHRKNYAWIEISNWVGDLLGEERLWDLLQKTKLEHPSEVHVASIPTEVSDLAQKLSLLGYVKQAGAESGSMFAGMMRPFLERISERLGVTYRELMRLSHEEIHFLLAQGTNEEARTISSRRQTMEWLVFSTKDGAVQVADDPIYIQELSDLLIPKVETSATELRGQIGFKGSVRGTARVIMNVDDFGKMNDGDILVTTMTTPDFVILMQKSSAIVTDIGGLLSHASIMSRELKKPCIIGTKFATQIFKDGDLVEVDATTGMVRKI